MFHTEVWSVEIHLFEEDADTGARATLVSGTGPGRHRTLTGVGHAHARSGDVPVAEIGAEIAAARALRDLSDKLLRTASEDIAAIEHQSVRLTR
jgi:Domain of unknown function (DUF1876)